MNLLECDGKTLLAEYGCPIPEGTLWPALPDGCDRFVVKAQIPAGKRGLQGGIRFAETRAEVNSFAKDLTGQWIGEHEIAGIYIEQRLNITRECYLAITLDRDHGHETLLASNVGGTSIESGAEERLVRLPIDPLLGLRTFHAAEVARVLSDNADTRDQVMAIIMAMYRLAHEEDAELVEINPLAILEDGRVMAADAKIALDDNAAFRRVYEPEFVSAARSHTSLEQALAAAGTVGIEIDPGGEVIAVASGAGLMMATLDLLSDAGVAVRCVIDLGGAVLAGGDGLRRVFEVVASARPKVTFFNAFLHTGHCDEFARMLQDAQQAVPLDGEVIVRLNGRNAQAGHDILHGRDFQIFEKLEPAIAALHCHMTRREHE